MVLIHVCATTYLAIWKKWKQTVMVGRRSNFSLTSPYCFAYLLCSLLHIYTFGDLELNQLYFISDSCGQWPWGFIYNVLSMLPHSDSSAVLKIDNPLNCFTFSEAATSPWPPRRGQLGGLNRSTNVSGRVGDGGQCDGLHGSPVG